MRFCYVAATLATVFVGVGFLSACAGDRSDVRAEPHSSELKTDLGLTGNSRVRRNFEHYRTTARTGCHASGQPARRILLTGFGPFNRQRNISGAVISLLQNSELWPGQMSWPGAVGWLPPIPFSPTDDPGDLGATAVQRRVRYDGIDYELCLLSLSVEWDFAAAIILHEAERFRPDFILMTGYGTHLHGVRLEAGALNSTRRLSGFGPNGRALGELNAPVSEWIVPPETSAPPELGMGWNPQQIAAETQRRLTDMSARTGRSEVGRAWEFIAMTGADPENNYVCNNVSYAVLAGVQLKSVPLAGGRLVMRPQFETPPAAAFLHYPFESNATSSHEVWAWTHVLMSVVARVSLSSD